MGKLTSWLLVAVTILTFTVLAFLRFYKLGVIPSGLTKDESYYGYDAYSILSTGRDIWGQKLPLFFKSTGEYKLNLTYLIVPSVKLLGLTEQAVRLPSAVFGFATVIVLFLTLKHLFNSYLLALGAAVTYALSPWAFGMSRLFYEANVGLFFVALGVYATLKNRLNIAAISLAMSAYLYNPYRYIGVILLFLACIYCRATLPKLGKSILLYLLVLLPLVGASPSGGTIKRLEQEWLLHKSEYEMTSNDMRAKCDAQLTNLDTTKICYLLWNKPVLHLANVSSAAFRSVSPELLFTKSTNEYIIPNPYGIYLSVLLPFYVLGLSWLFGFFEQKNAPESRLRRYIILATLASVVIVSAPGSLELYRYGVSLYLIFLIIVAGMSVMLEMLKKQPAGIKMVVIGTFSCLALFQQTKYLISYRLSSPSLPLLFAKDASEIFTYLESKREYTYIVDKKFHGPITAAFVWRIDPHYFQDNIIWTDPDPWGFVNAYRLGNIYSQTHTIESLLCEKHKNPTIPIKAAVIDDPGKYREYASFKSYDYSGTLNLHDVYDIDELYPIVLKSYKTDLCQL